MAAPPFIAIGNPRLPKLIDGFRTLMTFSLDPNMSFYEIELTPPGMDVGDAIDVATMRNGRWRDKAAKALVELTEITATVAWNPALYDELDGQGPIRVNGANFLAIAQDSLDAMAFVGQTNSVTVLFPNLMYISFWGYIRRVEPQSMKEGDFPQSTINVMPTNRDPFTGVEAGPVWGNAANPGVFPIPVPR